MKKLAIIVLVAAITHAGYSQLQQTITGVKWDMEYEFEKFNSFEIEFFAKGNELMRTLKYKTAYQNDAGNFMVKLVTEGKGSGMETIFDVRNQTAIQIMGPGGNTEPYYNAGGYKMPAQDELRKLEVVPTGETRQILGHTCKKYTYTHKKIFGEIWITDQLQLPNDIGIFRAAKMTALYHTLSVEGFVMEMTSEDARGGKTLMKTVLLEQDEKTKVVLKDVKMNTAINKISYYTF